MECEVGMIACDLHRIADAIGSFDWWGAVSTLLATLVGAAVAVLATFWVNNRERPRPVWRIEPKGNSNWQIHDGKAVIPVEITNIGDGAAYNLRIEIKGVTSTEGVATSAVLEPGETFKSGVFVPASGSVGWDEGQGLYDTREIVWPDHVVVDLEWQQPPRRHKVRKLSRAIQFEL